MQHDLFQCVGVWAVLKFVVSIKNLFFNWDSLYARRNTHYEVWNYKKRSTKRLKHTRNLERTYSQKMPLNSRLKVTKIIGQWKAFYR